MSVDIVFKDMLERKGMDDVVLDGWTFDLFYPSKIERGTKGVSLDGERYNEEIWLTKEKLKIPVGKAKVPIRFFVYVERVSKGEEVEEYKVKQGIVPDVKGIDDFAKSILLKKTRNKFHSNPYYHLLKVQGYSTVFFESRGVGVEDINDEVEEAKRSVMWSEKNLNNLMEGIIGDDGKRSDDFGWGLLLRMRSESLR